MRAYWGVLFLLCVACDSGSSGQDTDEPTSTTSVAPTSSSGDASSSSSSGPAGPVYAPQVPMCRKECDFAADCCPADQQNCPAPEFPANWGCVDGMCVPAPCEIDEQCEAITPGSTCHDVDGIPQCVVICGGDEACAPLGTGFACGGETTDGQGYCRERCDIGMPCLLETCNDEGLCECSDESDCINGFTCDVEAGM